jgi:protein-S-isoprenylcysteine O-methyltransferase Ste14
VTILGGLLTPLIAYAVITLLHVAIPVRRSRGYVTSEITGEVLNYRINGRYVLAVSVILWFLLGYFHIVPYTWLYDTRWWGLIGAVAIGLTFALVIVLRYPSTGKPFLADLWFGRSKDVQLGDGFVDAKVWLYLIGAVMLQLNVLSFAAFHLATFGGNVGRVNPGFLLGCAMLTWFCCEYLIFERIHLWTYDFIAERVGFKLGFGCLAFYPYFYSVALWFTADLPDPGIPAWVTVLFGVLFLGGWVLTRGANMQKYFFKTAPGRRFLWLAPEAISDGRHSLLVNGFWGVSRHVNYLGEIIQAVAIALAAGYFGVWMVWLYPLYYIALFLSRQADDDKVCRAKYGELWDEYTAKVKRKIVPGVY